MADLYDKYMTIYKKPFSEMPQNIVDETRERLAKLQSENRWPASSFLPTTKRRIYKLACGLSAR